MATESETDDWTIKRLMVWLQTRFAQAHISSARLDAELLLSHAISCSRVALYTRYHDLVPEPALELLRSLVRRRLAGEPIAYLIGKKEFFGLPLYVDQNVLIPQPDTETLVEAAIALMRPYQPSFHDTEEQAEQEVYEEKSQETQSTTSPACRILDVGTGSGAIALALKKNIPSAEIWGIDISSEALDVANRNAQALNLDVRFLKSDMLLGIVDGTAFDLIVSNPPYIPSAEIPYLAKEVRAEPLLALDGGADGLDIIRRLVVQAKNVLQTGGTLMLEIGAGQHEQVRSLFEAAGYQDVRLLSDMGGIPRVVSGIFRLTLSAPPFPAPSLS